MLLGILLVHMKSLEHIYHTHHETNRGEGFVLLGDERGKFLAENIGTGKNVLDIGCRDGALTRSYANGNTVLGLDIDSAALAKAREKLWVETKQVDLNGDWGVPAETFDVVVAAEVVEHLYYPGVVLDKIVAALKPGGILLGTVPNAFSLKNRLRYLRKQKRYTPLSDPTHINHFTVTELEVLLGAQFAECEVGGFGKYRRLAARFPQTFAFDLWFTAKKSL